MKKLLVPLLSFQMVFGPLCAQIQDNMANQLDAIKEIFDAQYAAKEWKEQYFGFNLEKAFDDAKAAVFAKDNITIAEFQNILRDCLNGMRDYHVSPLFYSTECSILPFGVRSVDGKFIITYVDEDRLSRKVFPINVGDELVSFDGRPPQEVVEHIMNELPRSNPETDQALAETFLTWRARGFGLTVGKGPVYVSIKPANSERIKTYQLVWVYYPESIKNGSYAYENFLETKPLARYLNIQMKAPYAMALNRSLVNSHFKVNSDDDDDFGSYRYLKRSFVPDLGEFVWQTEEDSPYFAYIYKTISGKNVGYLRIPTFETNRNRFASLISILEQMEANTDALVIDEVDNPGGYVFQVYSLASMLTEMPLNTPRHRMQITQSDVLRAAQDAASLLNVSSDDDAERLIGQTVFGYPVTYQFARFALDYSRFIISEWNAGRRLTEPTHVSGIDHINPHPTINYTKPLIILVNELDYSGGDFFPAIMQDNKRAVIFGNRTAGAGGILTKAVFPNRFGIEHISFIASIAERADRNPIENLGVTPDIFYKVTENDIRNGYPDYKNAVNRAVEGMFQDNATPSINDESEDTIELMRAVAIAS